MNLSKLINSAVDGIINLLAICAGILLIGIMLLTSIDVTMRYLFNNPIDDVLEIGEHILVFLTFLPAAWVLRKDRHVRMEGVISQFSFRTQTVFNVITSSMGALICLALFIFGLQSTWEYYQKGLWFPSGLRIPQYPILSVIVLSYLLLFIQFLRRCYGYVKVLQLRKTVESYD